MKYIFWDFNGTILDDAKLCYDILIHMLQEEKRPTVTFDEYRMIFTFPIKDYYAQVYDLTKSDFKDLAHRFIAHYQPRSLKLELHEGFLETYHHLKTLGYKQVLLSASQIKNLHEQLKHYQIDHLFDDILGTDDIYAATKFDVAKAYIKMHQIDSKDVTMVGDTLHDAEIADALGSRIILFTGGHQHPSRFGKYEKIDQIQALLGKI
ncbi:MAG: HAD hydrolase-like protein [Acholeplasmataceae bacterium]|jgi:phosphoglycolate phosphatase|nr:HAD hydrolase-like protein [Acholeplasmataceae bacterium]